MTPDPRFQACVDNSALQISIQNILSPMETSSWCIFIPTSAYAACFSRDFAKKNNSLHTAHCTVRVICVYVYVYLYIYIYKYVPGSKLLILWIVIPSLIGNPFNMYMNHYDWVDDHPRTQGTNGSLDPGTYVYVCICEKHVPLQYFLACLSGQAHQTQKQGKGSDD